MQERLNRGYLSLDTKGKALAHSVLFWNRQMQFLTGQINRVDENLP